MSRTPSKKRPSKRKRTKAKKPQRRKPVKGIEVEVMKCGVPTRNGNTYPSEIMANAIHVFNGQDQRWVTRPKEGDTRVRLEDVVGRAKLSMFEDAVTAHVELLDTPAGQKVHEMLMNGEAQFSTRGFGSIDKDGVVQADYKLLCVVAEEKGPGDE